MLNGELKRGAAPLTIFSPSPEGKGIQGIGPSLSNRGEAHMNNSSPLPGETGILRELGRQENIKVPLIIMNKYHFLTQAWSAD